MSFECGICSSTLKLNEQDKKSLLKVGRELQARLPPQSLMWKKLSEFEKKLGKVVVGLGCGHLFHSTCINRWFLVRFDYRRPPTCPYCNFIIRDRTQVHDLHLKYIGPPAREDEDERAAPSSSNRGVTPDVKRKPLQPLKILKVFLHAMLFLCLAVLVIVIGICPE